MEFEEKVNPEHILDMVYEGSLYMLLTHDTYETRKSEISLQKACQT